MAGLNVILVDYLLQPTLFYLRTILSVHLLLLLFFFFPKNSLYVPSDVYDVAESGTRLTKSNHIRPFLTPNLFCRPSGWTN